jgi:RNA 2',3'-cyclic 3'-phosphodiesterase
VRCFVACWPDDSTRRRLDQAAGNALARCPGARRVRPDNLHLTLAFIGELPLPKAREAAEALRRISSEPFEWHIDHIGRFERARVLWAGGLPEPRLEQLAERARSELRALQVRFDTKRFAAHVTLLRDMPALRGAAQAEIVEPIEPFDWPMRDALLMVSERDSQGATRYRALASP